MKRYLAAILFSVLAYLPASAVQEWGNGRLLVQHYNSTNCSAITGVDSGDQGSVCWQTTTNAWWDWNGSAWVARATGGGGGTTLTWVNVVEDHGAVGDGITDDTTAIQAAAAALITKTNGGILYFPPGNYLVTDRIVMTFLYSNYLIMGFGATLTIDAEIDGAVLRISAAERLEIAGLSIIDPDSTVHDAGGGEQTHGIVISGSSNVDIHHVYIAGMGDECLDVHSDSSNVAIRDSHFHECAETETLAGGAVGIGRSQNVWIENNLFTGSTSNTASSAIHVSCAAGSCGDDELRDIHIKGNQIRDHAGKGISVVPADGIVTGLLIAENTIRNVAAQGIRLAGSVGGTIVDSRIVDNKVQGGGESFDVATTAAGIHVSVFNSDGSGVLADNIVSAWGNTEDSDSHSCINVSSGGWTIESNEVDTCRQRGIESTAPATAPNLIRGNKVRTVVGSGIYGKNADKILGNDVYAVGTGIYYETGTQESMVAGNDVDLASVTGIRLNGTDIWAIGNKITDSLVGITGSGTSARATGNVFVNCGDNYDGSFSTAMQFGPIMDIGQDVTLLTADSATPSVADAVWFRTQNTGVTVTNFADGVNGQVIFVHVNDSNTTFQFSGASINGNSGADWNPAADAFLQCVRDSSEWHCVTSSGGGGGGFLSRSGTDLYPTTAGDDFCDDSSCTDFEIQGDGTAHFKSVSTDAVSIPAVPYDDLETTAEAVDAKTQANASDATTGAEYVDWSVFVLRNSVLTEGLRVDGEAEDTGPLAVFAPGIVGVGGLTAAAASCISNNAGTLYHDTDCDDTQDGGEENLDNTGSAPGVDSVGTAELDDGADTPSAGECLVVATATTDIEYITCPGGGHTTLAAHDDTNITTPSTNMSLIWDGADWIDSFLGLGSGGTGQTAISDSQVIVGNDAGSNFEAKTLPNCPTGNQLLWNNTGNTFGCEADDDTPDDDSEVPDAITVAGGSVSGSTVTLDTGADPTTDGQLRWDTTTERIEAGDDGVATLEFYPGAHNDEVGTKTAGDLCINDGTNVNCTVNTAAELETALDSINVLTETEIDASAELAALMDDETGTGALCFATSPTFLTSVTIPQGATPTVDVAGKIAWDTTPLPATDGEGNLKVHDGSSGSLVLPTVQHGCASIENLAAADDDFALWSPPYAVTIKAAYCECHGTCTTEADITLEKDAGGSITAMTGTIACEDTTTGGAMQDITGTTTMAALDTLRFDTAASPVISPETDTYTLCWTYTVDP